MVEAYRNGQRRHALVRTISSPLVEVDARRGQESPHDLGVAFKSSPDDGRGTVIIRLVDVDARRGQENPHDLGVAI
jgi:hypothetical protein